MSALCAALTVPPHVASARLRRAVGAYAAAGGLFASASAWSWCLDQTVAELSRRPSLPRVFEEFRRGRRRHHSRGKWIWTRGCFRLVLSIAERREERGALREPILRHRRDLRSS